MLEDLQYGLIITIICMAIVFLVLALLIYIIKIQRVVTERISGKSAEASVPNTPQIQKPVVKEASEDDGELIAAIAAAVAAVMGRPASNIVVRSIRALDSDSPVWNAAGRQDQMANRF